MKSWLTNGSVAVCHSRWCVFEICSSDFRGARRHSNWCINVFYMQDDLVCTLRLLAVKALLHHKIFHSDDTLALQCDLDKLGLWADRCQMVCKPTKCYKIFLYRSKSPAVKDYTLYSQTLVAVQQHPYSGVLLSSDLRWNSHVDKIARKGNSTLAFVKRILYACSEETKQQYMYHLSGHT